FTLTSRAFVIRLLPRFSGEKHETPTLAQTPAQTIPRPPKENVITSQIYVGEDGPDLVIAHSASRWLRPPSTPLTSEENHEKESTGTVGTSFLRRRAACGEPGRSPLSLCPPS